MLAHRPSHMNSRWSNVHRPDWLGPNVAVAGSCQRSLFGPLNHYRFLLFLLFGLLVLVYNANMRSLSSGDCVPAKLLPFSLWVERDLDLDEFVHLFAKEEGFELAHYAHWTHGHWVSIYPVVTPVLIITEVDRGVA